MTALGSAIATTRTWVPSPEPWVSPRRRGAGRLVADQLVIRLQDGGLAPPASDHSLDQHPCSQLHAGNPPPPGKDEQQAPGLVADLAAEAGPCLRLLDAKGPDGAGRSNRLRFAWLIGAIAATSEAPPITAGPLFAVMSPAPVSRRRKAVCMAVIVINCVRTHVGKPRSWRTHPAGCCCACGINSRSTRRSRAPQSGPRWRCRSARRHLAALSPPGWPRRRHEEGSDQERHVEARDQRGHPLGRGRDVAERGHGVQCCVGGQR